ncbi:hypothetical protein [Fructobacillus papyrifericola]|nr:hypothetical protein [Fructobacillus papyrifericola]
MKKEYTSKAGAHTTIEIKKATPKEMVASTIVLIAIGIVVWWLIK